MQQNGVSIASLKEEGSRAFAMKDYTKAMTAWDKALAMDSLSTSDAALLHNNKAACHMVGKRYEDAITECSAALQSSPDYLKALVRRSKAYELLGKHKEALQDLQHANKLDGATDDTRAAERRVKELATGKKPTGMGNGLASRKAAAAPAARTAASSGASRQITIPVKLSFGDDTRAFHIPPGITYQELMDHVRSLFPKSGPFVLKSLDKEGDLLTIASRSDINRAINEAVEGAGKARIQAGNIPALRIHAVKVSSEEDVPKPPEDEMRAMQQMLEQIQRFQKIQQSAKSGGAQQSGMDDAAGPPQIAIDEWILSFVDLLKEYCGVDPDKAVEVQEIGNEKLTAAFQLMLLDDPKTEDLLQEAQDKFREQAALGMVLQAQVQEARATMLMYKAAADGAHASTIAADAEARLKDADSIADEAVAYCPSCLDSYLLKSNLEQIRAKIAANYLMEAVKPKEDIEDPAERQTAEEEANKASISKAFARVTGETAAAADEHMESAFVLLQKAIDMMPQAEKDKELKPLKPMAEQGAGDPETPLKATLLINLGNAHYEHSILRAAGGLEWRESIKKAQSLFREAGAAEIDIRNALKGHPKADDMEDIIGPEPVAEEDKKAAQPKGVPALPKKK